MPASRERLAPSAGYVGASTVAVQRFASPQLDRTAGYHVSEVLSVSLTNPRPDHTQKPDAAPGPKRWSLFTYETQVRFFLIPFFLGSLILIVLPALITLVVAFTKYNAIQPPLSLIHISEPTRPY